MEQVKISPQFGSATYGPIWPTVQKTSIEDIMGMRSTFNHEIYHKKDRFFSNKFKYWLPSLQKANKSSCFMILFFTVITTPIRRKYFFNCFSDNAPGFHAVHNAIMAENARLVNITTVVLNPCLKITHFFIFVYRTKYTAPSCSKAD